MSVKEDLGVAFAEAALWLIPGASFVVHWTPGETAAPEDSPAARSPFAPASPDGEADDTKGVNKSDGK